MPKPVAETPEKLRPFLFHGLDLEWTSSSKDATAQCPWCGRNSKFNVLVATGQWRCVVCGEDGNIYSFLQRLHEASMEAAQANDYEQLRVDRKLLSEDSLRHWGLCKSILTDNWLLPGYNDEGRLTGAYQYLPRDDRMAWYVAPTMNHHLIGSQLFDHEKNVVYLCEGLWDAIAWYEVVERAKWEGETIVAANSGDTTLLAEANILAIPSSMTFFESWCHYFEGKQVVLMSQNDHPKKHPKTGQNIIPASWQGMQRITRMLLQHDTPPEGILIVEWGPDGYDLNLKSGFDVRDLLTEVP